MDEEESEEKFQKTLDGIIEQQQKLQQLLYDTKEHYPNVEQQLTEAKNAYANSLVNYKLGNGAKKEVDVDKKKVGLLSDELTQIKIIINFSNCRIKSLADEVIMTQRCLVQYIETKRLANLKLELKQMRTDGMTATGIAKSKGMDLRFVEKMLGINQIRFFDTPGNTNGLG